jgi:nitric oxide reductase activation protein
MDGEISKKNVTKKDKVSLEAVEEAGMEYKEVGQDLKNYEGKSTPTKVIVVKNFSKKLIKSVTLRMACKLNGDMYDSTCGGNPDTYIEDGIRLGTMLGRKLQIRSETRETKYTRKLKGRIDKRLIAELGFDNENVFSQTFMDSYPDAFLHISVDASGSMSGDKWDKTMTSVVAMAKAIDMITNVDLVISFRSTHNSSNSRRRNQQYPLILIAYDSRKDSFNKVKTLFKYINVAGTTPEGLCYEAIMNDMIPTSKDRESYFLNFSDGMPMFDNSDVSYHYDQATNHTKKMVDEIKTKGIKVLSYFIGGSSYSSHNSMGAFRKMYGKDSQFIDVTSVMAVAKTMNKKFLEKN